MEKLTSIKVGFRKSKIDECTFYWGESRYIPYTDDYILELPDDEELMHIVAAIKVEGLDITEERDIEYLLGANIWKVESETYPLLYPQLIKKILWNYKD